MIKNNVQLKDGLSIVDKINMTRYIVNGYFIDGEYTPYYADINKAIAFFKYCIEGLEFEDDDDVYSFSLSDTKLVELYNLGFKDGSPVYYDIQKVLSDVDDMVDFYKKKLLISSSSIVRKIEELLDKEIRNKDEELRLAKQMEKTMEENQKQIEANNRITEMIGEDKMADLFKLFADNKFSPESMADAITKSYSETFLHENKTNDLIKSKNDKIIELQSIINKE